MDWQVRRPNWCNFSAVIVAAPLSLLNGGLWYSLITSGYQMLAYSVMGLVLGAWK